MTTNLKHLSMLLAGALAVTSCAQQQQQQATPPPAAYSMITIESGDCSFTKSQSASITGVEDIVVVPQVAGTLTKTLVEEGDKVRKGQVMFVIDQVPYRAALQSAEAAKATAQASLETAQLTLNSKKSLYEAKVVSEFDYLTAQNAARVAEAQLASAEAAVTNAKNNLSFTTVKAGANGVIGILPVSNGALVSSATKLTSLADNSVMRVYFSMAENELLAAVRKAGSREAAIAAMPEVELKLSDGSIYEQKGKVMSISGVIDPTTGTAMVRADFPNPTGLLHSGASGNVVVPTTYTDVITIPMTATFEIQDKVFVFQNVSGVAKAKPIEVMRAYGTNVYIVTEGLAVGEQIVAEGVGLLREGTPIQDKAAMAAAQSAPAAPAAEKK